MELLAERRVARESIIARIWRMLHSEWRRETTVNGDGTYSVVETEREFGKVVSTKRYVQTYDADIRIGPSWYR
jgi:hypothetical protein